MPHGARRTARCLATRGGCMISRRPRKDCRRRQSRRRREGAKNAKGLQSSRLRSAPRFATLWRRPSKLQMRRFNVNRSSRQQQTQQTHRSQTEDYEPEALRRDNRPDDNQSQGRGQDPSDTLRRTSMISLRCSGRKCNPSPSQHGH